MYGLETDSERALMLAWLAGTAARSTTGLLVETLSGQSSLSLAQTPRDEPKSLVDCLFVC
jgi:hypothetical protein